MKTLVDVVIFCHDRNIVHRDLKPSNIMYSGIDEKESDKKSNQETALKVQNNNHGIRKKMAQLRHKKNKKNNSAQKPEETKNQHGILKVIDWGDARQVNDDSVYQSIAGTIIYMAPEIVARRACYGWEYKKSDMWSLGVIAYVLVCGRAPFRAHNYAELQQLILKGVFTFPNDIDLSDICKNFIRSLLTLDTKARSTANDAAKHAWLVGEAKATNLGQAWKANLADFHKASLLKQLLVTQLMYVFVA